jgi:hypothetical protein
MGFRVLGNPGGAVCSRTLGLEEEHAGDLLNFSNALPPTG